MYRVSNSIAATLLVILGEMCFILLLLETLVLLGAKMPCFLSVIFLPFGHPQCMSHFSDLKGATST